MNARKTALVFAALLSAACGLLLTSCDPEVGPDATVQAPSPGLTIVADVYAIDQWLKLDSNVGSTWITAIADTAYYHGRAAVSRFVARSDSMRLFTAGDTTFIHYADNGDVEFYERFTGSMEMLGHGRWLPIPVGLKGTKTGIALDTTIRRNPFLYTYHESWTWSFKGPGSDIADDPFPDYAGSPIPALMTEIIHEVTRTDTLRDIPLRTVRRFWYAPTLGMLVRYEILTTVEEWDSDARRPDTITTGTGYSAKRILMR